MAMAHQSILHGRERITYRWECKFAYNGTSYSTCVEQPCTAHELHLSLTNAKPSAIFRLRSLAPLNAQSSGPSPPANLGIEIAPQAQIEQVAAQTTASGGEGKGKEVASRVEVGKVAEKVVKNVSVVKPSGAEMRAINDMVG